MASALPFPILDVEHDQLLGGHHMMASLLRSSDHAPGVVTLAVHRVGGTPYDADAVLLDVRQSDLEAGLAELAGDR